MADMRTFGSRLRALRLTRGLTQSQLSEMSGVHLVTICRWERDKQAADLAKVESVAAALAAPRSWLLLGEGDAPELAPGLVEAFT